MEDQLCQPKELLRRTSLILSYNVQICLLVKQQICLIVKPSVKAKPYLAQYVTGSEVCFCFYSLSAIGWCAFVAQGS